LIQKKDGTTLYLTRDIGAAISRNREYNMDKMIYVVASQQDLHLAQLFKILELMEEPVAKKCIHINYGLVLGMSTRKGTAVFLEDILNQTRDNTHELMQKNESKYKEVEDPDATADVIGMAAVRIQDFTGKRVNNYEFSWARMLSFEGDTGPYLQYAHSRLCSMRRRASHISDEALLHADFSKVTEKQAHSVTRLVAMYPDVILRSIHQSEASTIVTFLFRLTHAVSSCYEVLWVVGQPDEIAIPRLAIYQAARIVLNNGMRLLGLTPVERM